MHLKFTPDEYAHFWDKVDFTGPCWVWMGARNHLGYGVFGHRHGTAASRQAHRIAYMMCWGTIPDGLVVDHLCRTHACVRPDHLQLVTQAENLRRGVGVGKRVNPVTHCPQGHPYDEENTYMYKGRRACKECSRIRSRDHQRKTRGWQPRKEP